MGANGWGVRIGSQDSLGRGWGKPEVSASVLCRVTSGEGTSLGRMAGDYLGRPKAQSVPMWREEFGIQREIRVAESDNTMACVSVGYQNGGQEGRGCEGSWDVQ